MLPVTIAAGGGYREHALVDAGCRLTRDTTGEGRLRRGGLLQRLRVHPQASSFVGAMASAMLERRELR